MRGMGAKPDGYYGAGHGGGAASLEPKRMNTDAPPAPPVPKIGPSEEAREELLAAKVLLVPGRTRSPRLNHNYHS